MSAKRKSATTEVAHLETTEKPRRGRKPGSAPKRSAIDVVRAVANSVRSTDPEHQTVRIAAIELALAITEQKGSMPSMEALAALAALNDSDRGHVIWVVQAAMANGPEPIPVDTEVVPVDTEVAETVETEADAVAA